MEKNDSLVGAQRAGLMMALGERHYIISQLALEMNDLVRRIGELGKKLEAPKVEQASEPKQDEPKAKDETPTA